MDEQFETLRGRDAQKHIVGKAREVADRVRSTLGPLGFDKMLVDKMGEHLVTNDGATILRKGTDRDPVARIVAQVAKAQEESVFDGTTSTVILLAEFLKQADLLIERGVQPNSITRGYRKALEIATATAY